MFYLKFAGRCLQTWIYMLAAKIRGKQVMISLTDKGKTVLSIE